MARERGMNSERTATTTVKKPARKAANPAPSPPVELIENIEDEVRQRAYELWEDSGREEGRAQDHWLQAEAEVLARRNQRSA
jgi:hypothetical protein